MLLLALSIACISGQAEAACLLLGLSGVGTTPTFSSGINEYKPYDSATYLQTISFQVQGLVNVGTCTFFVALKAGQSGNASARKMMLSAQSLNYQAYTDPGMNNVLLPAAASTASNVVTGSFPLAVGLGQSTPMNIYWTIAPQQVLAASGTAYSDAGVALELYEGTPGGAYTLKDTVNLTFKSKIESGVDIAIAATGGTYASGSNSANINFGTPVSGAVKAFDLSVRSNDGYLVKLQSAQGQKLVRTAGGNIPYTIKVNGGAVNLSGAGLVTVASQHGGTTPVIGTNLPVEVKLGTLTGAEVAGTYQDDIAVSISAN